MDSRFRGNGIKGCGNDREGSTRLPRTQNGSRNDILDRRDACPTWLIGLGLPRFLRKLAMTEGEMDSRFRGNDIKGSGNDIVGGRN